MTDPTIEYPPADTAVHLRTGTPGTYDAQTALVHHQQPTSGHSNLPQLVWLECDVIWFVGTANVSLGTRFHRALGGVR